MSGSEKGSGVGKGGGTGGTIRESGGSLGMRGATKEDEYFRKKDAEQIASLKNQGGGSSHQAGGQSGKSSGT